METRRVPVSLVLVLAAGFGYGMAHLPSPRDPHVFWVGNLCAPWLVISFLSGRIAATRRSGALAGAAADVACVLGFYLEFLTRGESVVGADGRLRTSHGLPTLIHWLTFCGPWLVAAVVGGAAYGLAGRLWQEGPARPLIALVVAAPFMAEPLLWAVRDREVKGPIALWPVEIAVGIGVFAVMTRRFRARAVAPPQRPRR